jgi:hypothetical protein
MWRQHPWDISSIRLSLIFLIRNKLFVELLWNMVWDLSTRICWPAVGYVKIGAVERYVSLRGVNEIFCGILCTFSPIWMKFNARHIQKNIYCVFVIFVKIGALKPIRYTWGRKCIFIRTRHTCTAPQAARDRVRFPRVSLEFFIDIILPAAVWPWGRLSL